ncbi:WLM domain-containing protein [Parasitella parasitica]|nr:WLM domain-containing protein [Parasitella parasitica]
MLTLPQGMNVNRGWKINLRLRPHHDETQFLEYEDILGTLLHEMAHIVRGPHDEKFYQLLDELKQETEILISSGYRGEGFYSDGNKLGSRSVPRHLSNEIAAKAAEKRLQTAKIMLPADGIRLGGSHIKNMTPSQLAARAAQKRQSDKVWCGGSVEQESSPSSSAASSPAVSSPLSGNNQGPKRRLSLNIPKIMEAQSKKKRTADSHTSNQDGWACPACTFLNGPITLACQICQTERPYDVIVEGDYWSCPQCTLENEKKWSTCVACQYVQLR